MTPTPIAPRVRLLTVLVACALVATAACSKPAAPSAGAPSELAGLQQTTALLQLQVDLAASKDFYLVYDTKAQDLALMLRGAELQRYQVLGVQVGQPRVSWFSRATVAPWQGVVWTKGALEPARQIDRLVMQGPEPGKGEAEATKAPPIPPTAEELYPVPSRYLIRFADGRSVEIRPREADASLGKWAKFKASWSTKWHDAYAAAFASRDDAVRLRLVLKPKDAESLYRGLPPAVRLLVI